METFICPLLILNSLCISYHIKTPFQRNSVLLTGHHAAPVLTLYFKHQCYLQDTMPCQWSSGDLPRVLRISESVFYSQAFFILHTFRHFSRLPWDLFIYFILFILYFTLTFTEIHCLQTKIAKIC